MEKTQSNFLLSKIAKNSYLVKDIASHLRCGADTPYGNSHFFYLEYDERYLKKAKKYVHKALTGNCYHEQNVEVLILPEKIDFLKRELEDANLKPLSHHYQHFAQLYAQPKIIFRKENYHLRCIFDAQKRFVIDEMIILLFEPSIPINYRFASLYFQSGLARFLHQATRQSAQSVSAEDIGNLYFPKLPISVQDSLLPVIERLEFAYRVFDAEKVIFWRKFYEYFFQTRIEISPLRDTFFEYSRPKFWQKVDELRKIGGMEDYKANRKRAKYLDEDFYSSQFKLKAMQAKIREIEKQFKQVVYQLYDLTEEEIKMVENG